MNHDWSNYKERAYYPEDVLTFQKNILKKFF